MTGPRVDPLSGYAPDWRKKQAPPPKGVPKGVTTGDVDLRDPPETTQLAPDEEQAFQQWATANKITDVGHPDSHYDYRGFWRESKGKPVRFGVDHFPDTYKQHGHPTFSAESKYSRGPEDGGHWEGDQLVPPKPRRIETSASNDDPLAGYAKDWRAKVPIEMPPVVVSTPDAPAKTRAIDERAVGTVAGADASRSARKPPRAGPPASIGTGYADSLATLIGQTPEYELLHDHGQGGWAREPNWTNDYRPQIGLTPSALAHASETGDPLNSGYPAPKGQTVGRHIVGHEYGHMAEYLAKDPDAFRNAPDLRELAPIARRMGATSQEFAEAFNAANHFLTSKRTDLAGQSPEVREIARVLLKQPLYAEHPLNGRINGPLNGRTPAPLSARAPVTPPVAPRDATRLPLERGVVDRPLTGIARNLPAAAKAAWDATVLPRRAAELLASPLTSALAFGRYTGQDINDVTDPNANDVAAAMGVPRVTRKEGGEAAAQVGAMAAGGAINAGVTRLLTKAAVKAGLAGDVAATGVVGGAGKFAPTVGVAAEGAGIGAAYDPEHPVRGAAVGGGLGALADVLSRIGPNVREPNLAADRTLPRRTRPASATATAQQPTPASATPDYDVTTNTVDEALAQRPSSRIEQIRQARAAKAGTPVPTTAPTPDAPLQATPPEHLAVRVGPIGKDGAYFSRTALPDKAAPAYDLRDVKIANGGDQQVVQQLTAEALKDPSLTPEQQQRLATISRDGKIYYDANDGIPQLRAAAQQLGYDGMQVFEADDTELPSSVFIWNIRKVQPGIAPPPSAKPRAPTPPAVKGFRLPGDEHGPVRSGPEAEVAQSLAALREEHASAVDADTKGELQSRINMHEAQLRKLRGEPEPEMATADDTRRARAAGVRYVKDIPIAPPRESVSSQQTVEPGPAQPGDHVFDALPDDLLVAQSQYVTSGDQAIARHIEERFASSPARPAFVDALRKEMGDELTVYRAGHVTPGALQSYSTDPEKLGFFKRSSGQEVQAFHVRPEDVAFPGAALDRELVINSSRVRAAAPQRASAPAPVERAAPTVEKHDYSSTQLDLPPEHAAAIQELAAKIPDADLATDGREAQPHITVKYGLHGSDPEKVRALLADEPPITVTLGKTSIFPNGESNSGDVVKIDVDSPALHALNKKIADALPHTDTHPGYKPHATVAYVKPGLGKKYAGDASLEGQQITLHSLTFSGKDGTKVEIPLGGGTNAPSGETKPASRETIPAEFDTPEIRALDERAASIPRTDAIDTPERNEWRQQQVDVLAQFTKAGKTAHLVLGLPGSGKSSLLAKPLTESSGGALLDNDIPKTQAAEYEGGLGATALHPESALIRNRALARVVEQGGNLVFPTIGDPVHTVALAKRLIADGYTVHVHLADVPPDVSARRVLEGHAAGTRHYVSPRSILEKGAEPRHAFAALAHLDGVIAHDPLDNHVPRGTAPRPVTDWRDAWGFPDAEPPGGSPALRPGGGPHGGRPRGGDTGAGGRGTTEGAGAGEGAEVTEVAAGREPPHPTTEQVSDGGVMRFRTMRAPSGGLRPVARVSTTGLLTELLDLEVKRADAESRSIYEVRDDPNFHTSGIPQIVSTKMGKGRPSMQAQGAENLRGIVRVTDRILAELATRMPKEDIWQAVEDARAERDERAGVAGNFSAAQRGNELRDDSGKVLFSPAGSDDLDLFGKAPEPSKADQGSLFGEKAGTEASRNLRQTETAARAELDRLRENLARVDRHGEIERARAQGDERRVDKLAQGRVTVIRRIAELEKLLNRDQKITQAELRTRAQGRENEGALLSPAGDDPVAALFSPAQPTPDAPSTGPAAARAAREVKTLAEIARTLADMVDVPLRQGRFNAGRHKAAGAFFPDKEVARLIRFDRLGTAAHEIGHYVSMKYLRNPTRKNAVAKGAPPLTIAMKRELVKMGKDLYGARKPNAGYGEEGIAEWAKFYVIDPAGLAAKAPQFSAWMDANVLTEEPALKQAMDQAQQDFADYRAAPATARIDAMIDVKPQRRHLPDARTIATKMIDDLAEIRGAVEEIGGAVSPARNAYILSRLTRGGAGMAEEMIERGIIDAATGKRVTKGIAQVLKQLDKKDVQRFRRYLVAERTLEVARRGVNSGISVADATDVVARYEKKFRPLAEELWAISNALIDYRQAKGLLTGPEATSIKEKNARRVGFYRVFAEDEQAAGRGGTGRGFGRNSSGLQKMKGSARQIIDPLESIVTDVYKTVQQSHAADVLRALVAQAENTQGGGRVVEVLTEAPRRPVSIEVDRVKDQLAELGFELPDGGLSELPGVLTSFEDLRQPGPNETKDLVHALVINGTRTWIQIKDAPLYNALLGLGTPQMTAVMRWLSIPTRTLRAGATLTAEFIARNPVRDAFTAAVYSRAGTRPPGWDLGRGLFHVLTQDQMYQDWRLDGADNAAMLGLDRVDVHKHVRELMRSRGKAAADWVLRPIDTLRMLSSLFENATRVGEYTGLRKKLAKEGMPERDARAAAAIGSRDVTIDFARAGEMGRQVNQIMAFFNANAQGWDKLRRELRQNPGSVIPRILAFITIPSLLLYYLQKDDPAYQEVPAWQKALAWVIVDRDAEGNVAHIWRIPKPPDLGILFGTIPERILDYALTKDPRAVGQSLDALLTLNPLHIPEALTPVVEWMANYNFFTHRPIVPQGIDKLPAGEQSTSRTGELARIVGGTLHASPAKIENAVRGTAGGLGQYGMDIGNAIVRGGRKLLDLPPLPRAQARRGDAGLSTPGLKGFKVRVPQLDAQSVQDVLDQFSTAEAHRQAWRRKLEAGDRAGAKTYLTAHKAAITSVGTREDGFVRPGPLRRAHELIVDAQRVSRDADNDTRERIADITIRAARAALKGEHISRFDALRLQREANQAERKGRQRILRARPDLR